MSISLKDFWFGLSESLLVHRLHVRSGYCCWKFRGIRIGYRFWPNETVDWLYDIQEPLGYKAGLIDCSWIGQLHVKGKPFECIQKSRSISSPGIAGNIQLPRC